MEHNFQELAGIEHLGDMLVGYGELVESTDSYDNPSANGHYAHGVLQMDSTTRLSGMESFLDSVKRGADKVYEWIKQLIKTIKEWLFGKSKKDIEVAKKALPEKVKYFDDLDKNIVKDSIKGKLLTVDFSSTPAAADTSWIVDLPSILKKLEVTDKKTLENELAATAKKPEVVEKIEEIQDDTIEKMAGVLSKRLGTIREKEMEIDKLDQGRNARRGILGLTDLQTNAPDEFGQLQFSLKEANKHALPNIVRDLIDISNILDTGLLTGTDNLNKYVQNNHEDTPKEKAFISRAGAVLKIYGEITAAIRDYILLFDKEITKAIGTAWDYYVKKSLEEAKKSMSEKSLKILSNK